MGDFLHTMMHTLLHTAIGGVPTSHLILEGALLVGIIYLFFFAKTYRPQKTEKLSKADEEELLREWKPEPLVPKLTKPVPQPVVLDGRASTHALVDGREKVNFANFNFLGLVGNKQVEESAIQTVHRYGVGSCGPRGFYGTVDVHLDLEEQLAKFLGVEEAALYSYGFSTFASVIPAYSKKGDLIFCDEAISFATQKGIQASRSTVVYFKHNDMNDLRAKLEAQAQEDKLDAKKANAIRRFLVVEGLYAINGSIPDLKTMIELKYKYKLRIFLDETMSIGVLGKTGRGATEHCGVSPDDIDLISGSLETALGSIGGFSAGRSYVVDHQRLAALGYCFSASLPPLLAVAASTSLKMIDQDPSLVAKVRSNAQKFRQLLSNKLPGVVMLGVDVSPIVHLCLADQSLSFADANAKLETIVQQALKEDLLLTTAKYIVEQERFTPRASIRVIVNAQHTDAEMEKLASFLKNAVKSL